MTFTNLDVLASVAGGRSIRRHVPAAALPRSRSRRSASPSPARTAPRWSPRTGRPSSSSSTSPARCRRRTSKPTRLGAAQAAVRTFLDKAPKNLRVGLIAFAGEPQVAAPPTTDHEVVRASLDTLGFFNGFGGTAIGDALAAAVELAKPTPSAQRADDRLPRRRAGEQPGLDPLPLGRPPDPRAAAAARGRAARAKSAGIPVYTVALGTPNGVLDRGFGRGRTLRLPGHRFRCRPIPQTLSQIAQLTGGQFFDARSAKALSAAYSHLGSRLGREPGRTEITYVFAALGAALLVAAGLLGALVSPRLP